MVQEDIYKVAELIVKGGGRPHTTVITLLIPA
jgi:hypothetical protein